MKIEGQKFSYNAVYKNCYRNIAKLPCHSRSLGFFWQALLNDSLERKSIVLDSKQRREFIVPSTSFDTCRSMKAFNDQVMIPNDMDKQILITVETTLPLK